jgi:arsenate reductase
MAEAFARAHGSGVIEPQSAGLAPARTIASRTQKVMLEKNLDMKDISSKGIDEIMGGIDLIINMSGEDLPFKTRAPVERWDIRDPIGESKQVYREVRDEIEQRVTELIASVRGRKPAASAPRPSAARVDSRGRTPRK